MNNFFKYFQFTAIERRGFIILLSAVLIVNLGLYVYKFSQPNELIAHQLYDLKESKEQVLFKNERSNAAGKVVNDLSGKKNITYFAFDPNSASEDDWENLGLTTKQVNVILNYRNKGGRFYKKEDLKKIYSLSESDYNRLEPYIQIKDSKSKSNDAFSIQNEEVKTTKHNNIRIMINTADTSEFKKLRGIGSVLASRIIKFRDALGGFYSVDQLKEVYGLQEDTFENIKDKLIIVSNGWKRINVNQASIDEFAKHPYINRKKATAIVNYRNQHENYQNINAMFQNKALDQDFLRKIEPYLEF